MELTFDQQVSVFVANHPVMVVAWFATLVFLVGDIYRGLVRKFKIVSNNEAVFLANKENARFVDLRSEDEFNKAHIMDSVRVSALDIKNNNLKAIEKSKEMPLILVCTNGFVAETAARQLTSKGFKSVYVLQEGINGWKANNLPTLKK